MLSKFILILTLLVVALTASPLPDVVATLKRPTGPKGWTTGVVLEKSMVSIHNAYRAHHGVPPLQWDPVLARAALKSAKKCIFAHTNPYRYGENLAGGTPTNPAFYVYLWYNEVNLYNFSKPGFTEETGHFTQMMWLASTHIGCAWVEGCSNGLPNLLFCEYSPNGNLYPLVNYVNNVPRPSKRFPPLPPVPKAYDRIQVQP